MFWLVLYYTSVVVIPEKYPTIDQCTEAGQHFIASKQFSCIPAAPITYCQTSIPNSGYAITVPCSNH